MPGCELTDGLDVHPTDRRCILNKRRYDCFLGPDLDLLLRGLRVENLICCGVEAHVCVMSTFLTARNLDYRVLLPRDATAGVTPAHYDAALLCMSDVFAYVTDAPVGHAGRQTRYSTPSPGRRCPSPMKKVVFAHA